MAKGITAGMLFGERYNRRNAVWRKVYSVFHEFSPIQNLYKIKAHVYFSFLLHRISIQGMDIYTNNRSELLDNRNAVGERYTNRYVPEEFCEIVL